MLSWWSVRKIFQKLLRPDSDFDFVGDPHHDPYHDRDPVIFKGLLITFFGGWGLPLGHSKQFYHILFSPPT